MRRGRADFRRQRNRAAFPTDMSQQSLREKLSLAGHDDQLDRTSGTLDDPSPRGGELPKLSVENRLGRGAGIGNIKRLTIGANTTRQSLVGELSCRRPAVGRVRVRRVFGEIAEHEVSVERRRKQLLRDAARLAAPGQRLHQRADRTPHDAGVDQLAARQPLGIGPAERRRDACGEGDDVAGRRADVDKQARGGGEAAGDQRRRGVPVRSRRL